MVVTKSKAKWGSKLGLILSTSAAAIGLGNIQRFPYIAAQNGGALFVLVYLCCVILLGLPLMLLELGLGRYSEGNPVKAIETLAPGSNWKWVGVLNILTAYFILTYYQVATGWTFFHGVHFLVSSQQTGQAPWTHTLNEYKWVIFGTIILLQLLLMAVLTKELKKGLEKFCKILMPTLFIILITLAAYSCFLPGFKLGIEHYLKPDFSHLSPKLVIYALSQAFFSLCIGEAVLITYGSYTKKSENLLSSSLSIILCDTIIALLAGLIIFPAMYTYRPEGVDEVNFGLIFEVLPQVFQELSFGRYIGLAFFMALSMAGLTTCLGLLEMPVAYLVQKYNMTRKKAVIIAGTSTLPLSFIVLLSLLPESSLGNLSIPFIPAKGLYEIIDFIWGGLGMSLGGFLLCLFAHKVWGKTRALKELSSGNTTFSQRWGNTWYFCVSYIAPVLIFVILIGIFFE